MLMTELSQTEQNRKKKHCCYQKRQTENLISQTLSYNEKTDFCSWEKAREDSSRGSAGPDCGSARDLQPLPHLSLSSALPLRAGGADLLRETPWCIIQTSGCSRCGNYQKPEKQVSPSNYSKRKGAQQPIHSRWGKGKLKTIFIKQQHNLLIAFFSVFTGLQFTCVLAKDIPIDTQYTRTRNSVPSTNQELHSGIEKQNKKRKQTQNFRLNETVVKKSLLVIFYKTDRRVPWIASKINTQAFKTWQLNRKLPFTHSQSLSK